MSGITVTVPIETYNTLIKTLYTLQTDVAEGLEQLAIRLRDPRPFSSSQQLTPIAIIDQLAKGLRAEAKKVKLLHTYEPV